MAVNERAGQSLKLIGAKKAEEAYWLALESMSTLNKAGAELMMKYGASGATDVTGFGIKGYAQNLASVQG